MPVEIEFKEKVIRDTGKKKKKKKAKKKKKKAADDDEEKKEPRMTLDEKNHLMNHLLKTYKGYEEPEEEVV